MKRTSSTLIALIFASLALISLIWTTPTWDASATPLADTPPRISELGLRYALHP